MDGLTLLTIAGLALVILGFVFGAIYWAGNIASKLDTILSYLSELRAANENHAQHIEQLDKRLSMLEQRFDESEKH